MKDGRNKNLHVVIFGLHVVFWPYSNLIFFHASSIIFLLTMSNLMLYLLHSHFASSQKASKPIIAFVNVWCLSFPSGLINTSAIILSSFGQYFKHISCFFYEVMLYINMFDVRSVCELLCKCYASLIFAHDGCWYFLHISHIHMTKSSLVSQTASSMQWLVAVYFASVVDNAMVGCFLHFHEMTLQHKNTHMVMDYRLFASPTQSALQKPTKAILLPLRHYLKSKVPFKYLILHNTTIQCVGPAFDMNWLTILTAKAISALVVTITFIRDPPMGLYGTPFISICTLTNSSLEILNKFEFAFNEIMTSM